MIARSGIAGLLTGLIGGLVSSLYIIYESLFRPEFNVLFASLTTMENFMILTIFVLSFGTFGFGVGYYIGKRNEKFKL